MAELTGPPVVFAANTGDTSTTARHTVGTKAQDASGNEYRYVTFGAAAINGEVMALDNAWSATKLTAASRGFVGVALATQASAAFGWVQVFGVNTFVWCDSGVTTDQPVVAPVTTDLGHFAVQTTASDVLIAVAGVHVSTAPDSCASTALATSALSAPATVILCYPFVNGNFGLSS